MIAAYREPARTQMQQLIASVGQGVPAALADITTLGRTLKKRVDDVLAYYDRPGTPTAPPKRSTAGSNTSATPPSASATSPLHRQITPGDRQLQTPTTPSTVKCHTVTTARGMRLRRKA